MKTKAQLLAELDDTIQLLKDAVKAESWQIAANASAQIGICCRTLLDEYKPTTIKDLKDSLIKLGALLEQGSANVVHD